MLDMSLFKSFSSYFYFLTPPHIILLLLSSLCLPAISTALPLTSTSTQFINRNSNQLRSPSQLPSAVVLPYRYNNNNNNNNLYGKSDELMAASSSSVNSEEQNGFLEDNLLESMTKDYSPNLRQLGPPLNSELDDINPLLPLLPNTKDDIRSRSDEKITNDEINEVINRIIAAVTLTDENDPSLNQMDKHSFEILRKQIEKVKDEEDMQLKSELLQQILMNYPEGPLPIVYVEESKPITGPSSNVDKRSGRYYRRYPWKRQQKGKGSYDPDARYMCTPTRDEIFRLLVGLHETHKGNERKLVNFCNRRRPAKTVFTNIRFLG